MIVKFTIEILELAIDRPVAILRLEAGGGNAIMADTFQDIDAICDKLKEAYTIIVERETCESNA